ncbi:hypothetical protein [Halobacillus sp. A5]|uniref:hypothetical protein n=1 Tax=Halobacillus sp. A5 TaxID=2880263 RepID=UPI0020A63278|nr:hypothetical protein [Halobacillus sp. A5]MCP3028537.1 hypothetical protein [Halobacillus sp. A5]
MKNGSMYAYAAIVNLYIVLFYITLQVENDLLFNVLSVFGLLSLLFSLFYLPGSKRMLPLFLIGFAFFILIMSDSSITEGLLEGFRQMTSLIAILLIVPIISWILKEEPYIEKIMSFAGNSLNTSRRFYFGIMLITQILSFFLLFGSIQTVYQFIQQLLGDRKGEAWENFKGTALLRAFSLCTLWVISIPSFVFIVNFLDASLWLSMLQGGVISLFAVLLAVMFSYFEEKHYQIDISSALKEEIEKAIGSEERGKLSREVVEFASLFVLIFGTIFFLHGVFGLEILEIIPPVIMVYTLLYFIVKSRTVSLRKNVEFYFTEYTQGKAQQFSILLSVGLVIVALNLSGWGEIMIDGILVMEETIPFVNILTLLPFIPMVLSFFGIGPLPVLVLVGGVLQHVSLPYPPELLVLSITSGSVISALLSPFILPAIVLSSENGLSIFKNGFQFNILYAAAFYLFVQMYLQIVSVVL